MFFRNVEILKNLSLQIAQMSLKFNIFLAGFFIKRRVVLVMLHHKKDLSPDIQNPLVLLVLRQSGLQSNP